MKFLKYINEKSFSKKDIPKDFWVVFDLEEMKDQLKNRKVKGLKGISSNSDIQFQFLGVARDAMLQLPSKDLLEQNKITRIMYDNPHYLVSKNMWALKRLYNATQKHWADQVFGNLFDHIKKKIKDRQLKYDMEYYGVRNIDWDWSKKVSGTLKIDNLKDLTKIIKRYIENIFSKKTGKEYDIKEPDLQKVIYDSLKDIGKIYSDESEWVIKNDYLKIPSTSTLYILTPTFENYNEEIFKKFKENDISSKVDIFETIPKMREAGIEPGTYHKDDIYAYKKKVSIEKLTDPLKDKYKIVELSIQEFKRKQTEYFNR